MTAESAQITTRRSATSRAQLDAMTAPDLEQYIWHLGAGAANVVMQLSNNAVGYGVMESPVESGRLFDHPFKRARTTLTYLAVASMGTPEDRQAYRRAVNRAHAQVHSEPGHPHPYNAFDPQLQLWVAACLYKGWEDVMINLGLGDRISEETYQQGMTLGTTLQVPPELWPANRVEFLRYFYGTLDSLELDPQVQAYLRDIVLVRFLPSALRLVAARPNIILTKGYLPPVLREKIGVRWTANDQRMFDAYHLAARVLLKVLPDAVNTLPFRLLLEDVRWRVRTGRALI